MSRNGKRLTDAKAKSVTRMLFLVIPFCALSWVYISYAIAIYSTVCLGQVYTMAELSEPAITTILGVVVVKVVGNLFEHNDGGIFGYSNSSAEDETTSGGKG